MATILLIEDYPSTREAIRALLEQDGHTVLEAGTALEALTVAGVASPDLILLDLRLPDAHGFDLAQRLREESRMAAIPILAITGYPLDRRHDDDVHRCFQSEWDRGFVVRQMRRPLRPLRRSHNRIMPTGVCRPWRIPEALTSLWKDRRICQIPGGFPGGLWRSIYSIVRQRQD